MLYGSIVIIFWTLIRPNEAWKYDVNIKFGTFPDIFSQNIDSKKLTTKKTKQTQSQKTKTISQQSIKKQQELKNIKQKINEIISINFSETHWVWDDLSYNKTLYDNICNYYETICWFTYMNWNYWRKDKILYQTFIIYIIEKLDSYLTTRTNLTKTLYSINLNNSNWKRRWFAWHHSVTIYLWLVKSNKELFDVLTHELWHIIDLWIINWVDDKKSNTYTEFGKPAFNIDDLSIQYYELNRLSEKTRKNNASFKDFVSWYAMSDPFEDFAESVNMYINHHELFKKMAKTNYVLSKKFEFMNKIFWQNHIFNGSEKLHKLDEDPTRRPWDSTKI